MEEAREDDGMEGELLFFIHRTMRVVVVDGIFGSRILEEGG